MPIFAKFPSLPTTRPPPFSSIQSPLWLLTLLGPGMRHLTGTLLIGLRWIIVHLWPDEMGLASLLHHSPDCRHLSPSNASLSCGWSSFDFLSTIMTWSLSPSLLQFGPFPFPCLAFLLIAGLSRFDLDTLKVSTIVPLKASRETVMGHSAYWLPAPFPCHVFFMILNHEPSL